jgi:hypothetical protein
MACLRYRLARRRRSRCQVRRSFSAASCAWRRSRSRRDSSPGRRSAPTHARRQKSRRRPRVSSRFATRTDPWRAAPAGSWAGTVLARRRRAAARDPCHGLNCYWSPAARAGVVRLLDPSTGDLVVILQHNGGVWSAAWSATGWLSLSGGGRVRTVPACMGCGLSDAMSGWMLRAVEG